MALSENAWPHQKDNIHQVRYNNIVIVHKQNYFEVVSHFKRI
jgi:hypothetical protein